MLAGDRTLFINGVETDECKLVETDDGGELVFTFDIPLGACEMETTQEIVDDVSTIEFRISVELPPVDGVGDVVCFIITPKTFNTQFFNTTFFECFQHKCFFLQV